MAGRGVEGTVAGVLAGGGDEGVGAVGRADGGCKWVFYPVGGSIRMVTYAADFWEKIVSPLKALGKVLAEEELEDVALLESEEIEIMRVLVSSRGRSLFVILPALPWQPVPTGLGGSAALL